MRLEELPKAMQDEVRAALAGAAAVGRARRGAERRMPRPDPAHKPYRCVACRQTFKAYARAERHVDNEHTAGRIEWSDR